MKHIIKRFADIVGGILFYAYSPSINEMLQAMRTHIYTSMIKRKFKYFGKGALIEFAVLHLKGTEMISVGDKTQISKHALLTAWKTDADDDNKIKISIGNNCIIREGVHITAINKIEIGDNLLTGNNVLITDNSHGELVAEQLKLAPIDRPIYSKGTVKIGRNVWLGNNVCVMPGVTIGNGVVVGAGSVVTHDIPDFCLAAGMPAQIIKRI